MMYRMDFQLRIVPRSNASGIHARMSSLGMMPSVSTLNQSAQKASNLFIHVDACLSLWSCVF